MEHNGYKCLQILGQGHYGKVYKGLDPQGKIVAIKVIDADRGKFDDALSEIGFLSRLHHRNILKFFAVEIRNTDIWLCTEYLEGGSLHDLLKKTKGVKESHASYVIRSILQGLVYMHDEAIVHRDLKPANILLDVEGCIKLADFGVSAQLTEAQPERNTMIGTPYWMAPEVINQSYYGTAADMWSVGIIAIELIKGVPPFSGVEPTKAMLMIGEGDAPSFSASPADEKTRGLSSNYVSLVRQTVIKDASKRASARELVRQRWISRCDAPDRKFREIIQASAPKNLKPVRDTGVLLSAQRQIEFDFDPTVQVRTHVVERDAARLRRDAATPRATCPYPSSPDPTKDLNDYFAPVLANVMRRSIHGGCRIMVAGVHDEWQQLNQQVVGLAKTTVDEIRYTPRNTPKEFLMDSILQRVQQRATKSMTSDRLRLLRLNLKEINHQYPGFSKATGEELQGKASTILGIAMQKFHNAS